MRYRFLVLLILAGIGGACAGSPTIPSEAAPAFDGNTTAPADTIGRGGLGSSNG